MLEIEMNLKEITQKVREEVEHKWADPCDRLQANSDKALKYSEMLFRINRKRNKLRVLVEAKYSELHKNAKFNSAYLLKNKQDVESFINTDEEYKKLKNELDEYENISKFLENIVYVYQQREASERLIFKAKTGIGG